MKREPYVLAFWIGIGLVCVLCLPPRFLLFLLAVYLVVLGLCCRRR